MLNVHHVELFYYVAQYGGISAAVRQIPYGIGQPAVSAQVAKLEESLGVRLFHRRPFALTDAGRELFEFAKPFFAGLPDVESRVSTGQSAKLRLAASNHVLRDHLPGLLGAIQKRTHSVRLSLKEMRQSEAETALRDGALDVALVVRDSAPAPSIRCKELVQIPLALVFRKNEPRPNLKKWLAPGGEPPPLVSLPPQDRITQIFQRQLATDNLHWDVAIEASSLDVVHACVAGGFGVGLTLDLPGRSIPAGLERMRLRTFPKMEVLTLWRGKPDATIDWFIKLVGERALLAFPKS